MFTKTPISSVVRFVLILALLSGTYNLLPVQRNITAYALGDLPGTLDTMFDSDGLVTTDVSPYGDQGWGVAIQTDGKVVVGGYSHSGSSIDFMLTRYNNDGSLDANFDTDGKTLTDFGSHQDYGRAVALQPDGKIIVAGYSEFNAGSDSEFVLARYNTDGSLDGTFDSDGKVTTNLGSTYEFLGAMAIQEDGKILVVGSKNIGINNDDIAVVRYNSDGSLDITFSTDGIVTTAIGSGYEVGVSIALQPDGKILVGGATYNGNNLDLALVRYETDGTLDTGFGTDGIVTKDFGIGFGSERGGYIALQPDGKIVIAGDNIDGYFLLARYNDDGSPDLTFDADGFVATLFSGSSYDQVQDIVIQKNGKIVIVGYTRFAFGSNSYDFVLVRYNNNGSLDTSFDGDGKVLTDSGNKDDLGNAVALQPDGKIILAGYSWVGDDDTGSYDVAVARYIGDETALLHHVKWNANGTNDGSSWTNAFTDLQSALSAAQSGDEIWVAAGTYKPTTSADRTISFILKNGVAIYGGFAGTENLRVERDWETNVTVLSGDLGTLEYTEDNSYHVVIGSDTDNSAILDGFTIQDGRANGASPHDQGGGLFNDGGSPTLTNTVLTSNSAFNLGGGIFNTNASNLVLANVLVSANGASSGGGMYSQDSSPVLTWATFHSNSANFGGGMYNNNSSPVLTETTFSYNSATGLGGGIYNISGSNVMVTNSTFSRNIAESGGGIYNDDSNPSLTNVTLNGNSVDGIGGAIYNDNSSPELKYVTISNNSASIEAGGIFNYNGSSPSLDYVTINNNSADFGGGMLNDGGHPTVKNVTFSGNSANNGGGLLNFNSSPLLINLTLSDNSAGNTGGLLNLGNSTPTLINVVIANSTGGDCFNNDVNSSLNAASRNNLIENSGTHDCDLINGVDGNIIGVDPLLGPLADNGGFTKTKILLSGSPAIDVGDDDTCPATDQRGVTRPQGEGCDIGAYEYPSKTAFNSSALEDGWIRESTETSGMGGALNKNATTLRVGDDAANKQYRSILSFATPALPEGAVITSVTLKFKYQGKTGTLPFGATHGNLLADICKGTFKNNPALQLSDFNARCPTGFYKVKALIYTNTKVDNWYLQSLLPEDFQFINFGGVTQFRLRFARDDNNDFGADFLKLFSGNAAEADRPRLVIEYYIP